MPRELTPEAQSDRDDFQREHRQSGCTCCISPPCNACIHPGNPANQDEDDSCWIYLPPEEYDYGI